MRSVSRSSGVARCQTSRQRQIGSGRTAALLPFFGPPDVRVFRLFYDGELGTPSLILQRNRGLIPDCPVRAHLVVVLAPILHFRAGVVTRQEPVRVQALGPEAPVEGFDERVVGRLARTREVQR